MIPTLYAYSLSDIYWHVTDLPEPIIQFHSFFFGYIKILNLEMELFLLSHMPEGMYCDILESFPSPLFKEEKNSK